MNDARHKAVSLVLAAGMFVVFLLALLQNIDFLWVFLFAAVCYGYLHLSKNNWFKKS